MSGHAIHHQTGTLRLVGREELTPHPLEDRRAAAVARENALAATAADDTRAAFARRVADTLEGGRAAILRPEMRRDLVAAAVGEGLRPFDAHLVIAVVQDAARRGEDLEGAPVASRVGLVRPAEPGASVAWMALAAVSLAVVIVGLLVAWVTNAW